MIFGACRVLSYPTRKSSPIESAIYQHTYSIAYLQFLLQMKTMLLGISKKRRASTKGESSLKTSFLLLVKIRKFERAE